jgi:hypothetical protein
MSNNYPKPPGPPSQKRGVETYSTIDDMPMSPIKRTIIILLTALVLMSSMWVFSEMPGTLENGDWSAAQGMYCVGHHLVVCFIGLLVFLKG